MAEEEYLIQELRKIEARKKEREKRTQDLQKLITAADTTTEQRRAERKAPKKKLPQKKETEKPVNILYFPCSFSYDAILLFQCQEWLVVCISFAWAIYFVSFQTLISLEAVIQEAAVWPQLRWKERN